MLESSENLVIHHIHDNKDDICGSNKKIQPVRKILHQTVISWRYFPWPHILKCTYFRQFSTLEGTQKYFLDHIDDIK